MTDSVSESARFNLAPSKEQALNKRLNKPELVEHLARFVVDLTFDDLPEDAVHMASILIMDTLAVGVAATTYDATDKALQSVVSWGRSDQSRVLGRPGITLSAAAAAFVNGMQVHALEWDGLHEDTVVIALCASMGALISQVDSEKYSGKELICAFVVGVEVAVLFGGVSGSSPRFFRPSVAGGLGAVMALSKLRALTLQQTIAALGLAYSQICGTMQAHWEGSMALPMQVGASSRNAHFSVDMALAGMTGPVDIIAGQFNYFSLFELGSFNESLLTQLGKPFKIVEVAHKPFPAGRATQTVLTILFEWQQQNVFNVKNTDSNTLTDFNSDITSTIESIDVWVPPLIMLLVGRPLEKNMTASYARLCLRFIVPLMLIDGEIDPRRFTERVYSDPKIIALSKKINILEDGNPDANALGPQTVVATLNDGRVLKLCRDDPLGSPKNPLSREQRNSKVSRCFELGFPERNAQGLIDMCENLVEVGDCRELLTLVT